MLKDILQKWKDEFDDIYNIKDIDNHLWMWNKYGERIFFSFDDSAATLPEEVVYVKWNCSDALKVFYFWNDYHQYHDIDLLDCAEDEEGFIVYDEFRNEWLDATIVEDMARTITELKKEALPHEE